MSYKGTSLFVFGKGVIMNRYIYQGPVSMFGRCMAQNWKGTTYAVSEKKAKSNLAYQFKKQNKLLGNSAPVSFPGKLTCYEKGEY